MQAEDWYRPTACVRHFYPANLLHKHLPHTFFFGLHVAEVLLALHLVRFLQADRPIVCSLVRKAHLLEAILAVQLIVLRVRLLSEVFHVGSEVRDNR